MTLIPSAQSRLPIGYVSEIWNAVRNATVLTVYRGSQRKDTDSSVARRRTKSLQTAEEDCFGSHFKDLAQGGRSGILQGIQRQYD
jgi:hypothetical protein